MDELAEALSARGVGVEVGRRRLLDGIDLGVRGGEVLALLGPNGAGKSTLLRAMAGEAAPRAGEIALNGRPLRDWSPRHLARQRAVLPQIRGFDFGFTVEELVALGLSPHPGAALDPARRRAIVAATLAAADVAHLRHRRLPTLSGGEAQRAHLARVLAQIWPNPDAGTRYLLLDEPTSALDPAHQHGLLRRVRELAQDRHLGVLVVLHDLNLAALYADRVALLRDGRLSACGTPREVLTEAHIAATFGVEVDVLAHPRHPGRPLIVNHRARNETGNEAAVAA